MLSSTWTPPAVSSEARPWVGRAWRMVEAQHVASTMKIVDDADAYHLWVLTAPLPFSIFEGGR